MNIPVDIKRIHPDALLPQYHTQGACAFDVASVETATIQAKEITRLKSGYVIRVPKGHTLIIAARSSTPKKTGLCLPHGIGIVDMDYCGEEDEMLIQVHNFSDHPVTIEKGQRIAQAMIVPIARAMFREVETMEETSRGGFGSTG